MEEIDLLIASTAPERFTDLHQKVCILACGLAVAAAFQNYFDFRRVPVVVDRQLRAG